MSVREPPRCILRYCTTPKETLLEQYKTLRNRIDTGRLVYTDVVNFPLDYSPKTQKMFLSMASKHDHCWTLAEYWIIVNRTYPPDFLIYDKDQSHNIIFKRKLMWYCRTKEVEEKLTLDILLKNVTLKKTVSF